MWVRFPDGTSQVSIEQQTFHVEHEDKEGNKYFQVPDHFAPTILDLLPGFRRVDRPKVRLKTSSLSIRSVRKQRTSSLPELQLWLRKTTDFVRNLEPPGASVTAFKPSSMISRPKP
jgi:hypothetical protein